MRPPYFIGPLRYESPPDNNRTKVLFAPLVFVDSKGERITSPASMETDGASVGSLLCIPILGLLTRFALDGDQFTGPFEWPAITHDGEYGRAQETSAWKALISPARRDADRRIYEGARTRVVVMPGGRRVERHPAPWWRAAIVHALLRVAGWKAWMDDASKAQRSLARIGHR